MPANACESNKKRLAELERDNAELRRRLNSLIAEQGRAEERLRLQALLFNQVQDRIIAADLDGRITYANEAECLFQGKPQPEIIGQYLEVHGGDTQGGPGWREIVEATRSRGEWRGLLVNAGREGTKTVWNYRIRLVHEASGRPVGLVGIGTDTTGLKNAEDQLRAAYDIINQSPAAAFIWLNEPGWPVAFVSQNAEDLFGHPAEDFMTGKVPYTEVIHPDDLSRVAAEVECYSRENGGSKFVHEPYRIVTKTGQVKWVEDRTTIKRDQAGRVTRYQGIVLDITGRRRAEEELRETILQLEEAIARANEMAVQAELANAAKSGFLANMSHEIRTPMNGVIGMVGLLLDTDLSEEQRRYAEIVRSSGESLLALLNDILDFSKIEAGRLELEVMDFDLRGLLDDFAVMMAVRAHEKGLEFICAADPAMPTRLRGDPGRLRQVLTNLAGNAVKFTWQGEVAVRVGLVSETDAEAVLRFSVRDTGIGIPADKIGLLFQSFSQVDASTTRQYGGTGLGLAISKQLAGLMGGRIGATSELGRGAEFWFTARLAKQPRPERGEARPPIEIRGLRILVVDDNATNREVLTAQLASWGTRVAEAADGLAALAALRQAKEAGDPFQAAILDMQMPGLDGENLGRAIKADEKLKDVRLVMLSSLGQRGGVTRFEEIGFAAYLTKPVRQSELFDTLVTVLAGDRHRPRPEPLTTRRPFRELRGENIRILLAEDNITNQQVAVGILKKLGLRADAVANGMEAVKALENIPYDLVLMDVQMPEMDGLEATRVVRDPQSRVLDHDIPIIAMTAHAMQGDREICLEASMNDYVSKPIDPPALVEVLEKWLPGEREKVKKESFSEPAGEPAASVFDRAGMMSRLMGDEDLARTVVAGFIEDIPCQIEALRGYLDQGDALGAQRQAHTIKGAAGNMGGEALRRVASEIEKTARAGDLEAAAAQMTGLEKEFDRLKQAMEAGDHENPDRGR